jgi:predicted nucleic acid-binding protein
MEASGPAPGDAGSVADEGGAGGKAVILLNVFLDSSALAKRYVQESGSDRVEEILLSASSLGVSMVCLPEVVSALCRRHRERKLSRQQYLKAKLSLFEDLRDSSMINITEQVVERAVDLLERWPLRSSDSLHVASAAEWDADLFVSADERQCAAARGYGLRVEKIPA